MFSVFLCEELSICVFMYKLMCRKLSNVCMFSAEPISCQPSQGSIFIIYYLFSIYPSFVTLSPPHQVLAPRFPHCLPCAEHILKVPSEYPAYVLSFPATMKLWLVCLFLAPIGHVSVSLLAAFSPRASLHFLLFGPRTSGCPCSFMLLPGPAQFPAHRLAFSQAWRTLSRQILSDLKYGLGAGRRFRSG